MFDKDSKFGFIINNENSNNIKNTDLPYTVSSKVLATIPASDINLDNEITINNATINKDRRYYIEFLGSKKLCSISVNEEQGNGITCNIGDYVIEVVNDSTNISLYISKINTANATTVTFTDLVIHEEEVKYLDSKYLETDLVLQNSMSLGRVGDIGEGSSAVGYFTEASGSFSHAEGNGTIASGDYSHAEGDNTIASIDNSHAEGSTTIASGTSSHAEGSNTIASGDYGSHAEGYETKSEGDSSHAEGNETTASGNNSHAEGSNTTASGIVSHAEGGGTTASGNGSHAEGYTTTASGNFSHAEGFATISSGDFQHVQGKLNIEDTAKKYAHIVGNGEDGSNRSNAHTLDWKGNGWYAGKLSQEGTPTEDKDLTTKKYVDDNTVIRPLPVHTIQETAYAVIKVVNVMDLIEGVQYSTHKDLNEARTQSYRIAYVCDDGSFKLIRSLPLKNKVVHLLKVVHSTKDNYSTLSYNNIAYKVDYTKHSTNTDVEVTETLQNYLPIANITEYTPTKDYHPATKKYVDDRFICTDIIENVGVITKEEMQKCNNGTSRYVSSINFKEFFADYKYTVYQGTYGDKNILIKYDAQYNRMLTDVLDTVDKYNITLGFNFDNNYMYPFSGGASQVKSYQFTNDLVITKNAVLNPSEIYSKGLREYVGTKENPVLFTEIKNGWNIVKNYYKWYAEYENSIPCGDMLVHKCPHGKTSI